jgi:DNA-binding NarL/FixJ family response regulator
VAIRIALIDENKYESLLISNALLKQGIEITHLLHSFINLPKLLEDSLPDVVIISIGEDAIDEVSKAEKIRSKHPQMGLVFLSSTPDLRLLGISEKDLPQGVQVIFKKSVTDMHVLSRAIHDAADHSKIKLSLAWVTGNSFTDDSTFASDLTSLTHVQIETLRLVAQGNSNAEIAKIRFVTEKAVEHSITRLLSGLNIMTNSHSNSRVLLAREYYRWVKVS